MPGVGGIPLQPRERREPRGTHPNPEFIKTMAAEKKLAELGLSLPKPPAAAGAYVPAVKAGKIIYLAGTLPILDGQLTHTGKIGEGANSIEYGYAAAKQCALNTLANLHVAAGSLDRVTRVLMVNGFVNGVDGFSDSPKVINGASELFLAVFGTGVGPHARAAVSVNGLPMNASVEIQVVVEIC